MSHRVGESGSPTPKKAPQDTTFQRFQKRALPRTGMAKQFELDSWLRCLSGSQLLDIATFVIVLGEQSEKKLTDVISAHGSRYLPHYLIGGAKEKKKT